MTEIDQDKETCGNRERSFTDIFTDDIFEAFHKENYNGTWTIEQLGEMEIEFNLLSANDEKQRKLLLYRFLNANIIFHIIIGEFRLISEYAYRKDLSNERFDEMRRTELISKNLSQFSTIQNQKEPMHDAHVKEFMYSKIPVRYQRKYLNEPELLTSIRRCDNDPDKFEISIEHLIQTKGFCRCCVGLKHRETLQAIPLSSITNIRLCPKENGFYDLAIETR